MAATMLLGATMLAGLSMASAARADEMTKDDHLKAGRKALQDEDYKTAKTHYTALHELDPDNPSYCFLLGRIAETEGDLGGAHSWIDPLADPHQDGYPQAHVWLARQLLVWGAVSPKDLEQAEAQLLRAVRFEPTKVEAHELLGRLYLAQRKPEEAIEHFEQVAEHKPEYYVNLARMRMMMGMPQKAREAANQGLQHFQRLEADPNHLDDTDARVNYAEALLFLEQFEDAAKVLEKGLKLSDDDRYRTALGRVYLIMDETLIRQGRADPEIEKQILGKSFLYNSKSLPLLRLFVIRLNSKDEEKRDAMLELLDMLLESGDSLSQVHLLLAFDAEHRGDEEASQNHLNETLKFDKQTPVLLGDLARYLLSMTDHVSEARQLVSAAVRTWPDDPEILFAQGVLEDRTNRSSEAVTHLEKAISIHGEDWRIHRVLADLYRQMKNSDKAEEHFRLYSKYAPPDKSAKLTLEEINN